MVVLGSKSLPRTPLDTRLRWTKASTSDTRGSFRKRIFADSQRQPAQPAPPARAKLASCFAGRRPSARIEPRLMPFHAAFNVGDQSTRVAIIGLYHERGAALLQRLLVAAHRVQQLRQEDTRQKLLGFEIDRLPVGR